ncbi:MAG: MSCRAMM family protein, partial [Thermomicrobiales bacterium]
MPAASAGLYVAYDANTGAITATPAPANVELVTDLGQSVPLQPGKRGGYTARFDAPAGAYGVQILVNGQPVAQDSVQLDQDSRVIFETDDSGQVTRKDIIPSGELAVTRTNDTGQPLPDACYGVYDGGTLLGQACDGDDGTADGQTLIEFPNGVDQTTGELRETQPPDGADAAEPQRIDLAPGDQTAAVSGPAATDGLQPDAQPDAGAPARPGQLAISFENARGNPLPGACVEIVEFGFQACDDDNDGTISFDALQPGLYTIRVVTAPEGRELLPDQQVELQPNGARVIFNYGRNGQQPNAETPEPAPSAQPGSVDLVTVGADGAPVGGGCYALVNRDTGERREQCDDAAGAADGLLTFSDVPAGPWTIQEISAPAGLPAAQPIDVDVQAGESTRAGITYQSAPQPQDRPGALRVDVLDDNGNPLSGGCFDLVGPVSLTGLCDPDGSGRFVVNDLQPGDYTLRQTQTPDGYDPA